MVSGNFKRRPRWSISVAKHQPSRSVPRFAVILIVIASAGFGVFSLVRLARVSVGCTVWPWNQTCPGPTYPIFDRELPHMNLCPCSTVRVMGPDCKKRDYVDILRRGLWQNRTATASYVRLLAVSSCAINNQDVEEIVSTMQWRTSMKGS